MKDKIKAYAMLIAIISLAALLASVIALRVARLSYERKIEEQEPQIVEAATPTPEVCCVFIPAPSIHATVRTVVETVVERVAEENIAEVVEELAPPSYLIECGLDADLQEKLHDAAKEFGVDYLIALSVVSVESSFQNVMGDNGHAYGYMQIQQRFHYDRMERLGVTDLMDAESNFRVGCSLLADLIEQYGTEGGLTAYNTGHSGTSYYATKVLSVYEDLKGANT